MDNIGEDMRDMELEEEGTGDRGKWRQKELEIGNPLW